jgi:hypothetical protein
MAEEGRNDLLTRFDLFDEDGVIDAALIGAAATVAAPAAAITGGESPTEAEFNALRLTVANLITNLKAAGLVAEA